MYELALFAGAGGGILGGILCGHTCIGAVEIEEYPREVLKQRQRDGILPRFPIWDDICTFRSDNPECSEYFDFLRSIAGELVISGGFPCQDISAAGKGAGIEGSRSGLWGEMARIIGEVRPAAVLVENSPLLVSRGLAVVLGDLAELGYDARWCVLGADDAGAPHRRKRIWLVGANSDLFGCVHREPGQFAAEAGHDAQRNPGAISPELSGEDVAYSNVTRLQRPNVRKAEHGTENVLSAERGKITWWLHDPADMADCVQVGSHQSEQWILQSEKSRNNGRRNKGSTQSKLGRVAHGVAHRVDRLKAIGNGQVPAVVKLAWQTLTDP